MSARPAPLRVTIAALTFLRPRDIGEVVPMLLAQAREVSRGGDISAEVLVIDNDPRSSGAPAVRPYTAPDLRYVVEAAPGISAARNRALTEAAESDLIVFIDDDERPAPGWLRNMIATQRATGAAGVAGRVVSMFDERIDPWIIAGGFFARLHRVEVPTGSRITVAATNNLMLDLRVVRELGLEFDLDFGFSGGEDSLLTQRLTRMGKTMVWCAEAIVTESVPSARISRRWAMLRSISSGNSEAHVALRLATSRPSRLHVRLVYLVGGTARMIAGSGRAVYGWAGASEVHGARGMRAAARGVGMVGGAMNWRYEEYRRPLAREQHLPEVASEPAGVLRRSA